MYTWSTTTTTNNSMFRYTFERKDLIDNLLSELNKSCSEAGNEYGLPLYNYAYITLFRDIISSWIYYTEKKMLEELNESDS